MLPTIYSICVIKRQISQQERLQLSVDGCSTWKEVVFCFLELAVEVTYSHTADN